MKILGIHDGHTATACYFNQGSIISALSEERLTRLKGQGGFPQRSVAQILKSHHLDAKQVDKIALTGLIQPLISIDEYQSGRQKYFPHIIRWYPGDLKTLIKNYIKFAARRRLKDSNLKSAFKELGFDVGKIEIVEHHQAHAASAYYLSPFNQSRDNVLVITLDGSGDGLSGTISQVDENGRWKRLKEFSTFDSLGMVYSRVTQYLGMKPWEHEYKLMGMAPYVADGYAAPVLKIMQKYIGLSDDGLGLENRTRLWGNSLLRQMWTDFKGLRFDSISAGVQLLHEKMVVSLIKNWIKKTGISKLAVAGGCFMNVKANKLVVEMDECEDIFVMPSCGDDSCAIGAAIWSYAKAAPENSEQISPVEHLYWGPDYSESEIKQVLNEFSHQIKFKKCENIEKESAGLLAEHKIIGRLSGKMEWGSRALGNRSILANPSRMRNIGRLNAAIKMRDFWMPFAPSILWEKRNDYAKIPKDVNSYYMTLAYDSSSLAREHFIAALHPYDFTMRPQFVKKKHNAKYHRLLSEFESISGIGGVLNTSFNLHGSPIICNPRDALETFINSALDYITIEDYLVAKSDQSF